METWGSEFNREEDPVPEERSVRKGSEAQEEGCPLKKTPSALDGPTAAKQLLAFHAAHLVVVVPSKFGPSPDSLAGKEGHPREAKIVSIHEDVLDKQVGAAAVIKVAAQVAFKLGVDDVARLFTIIELACVLTDRRTFPLFRRRHVG